MGLSRRLDRLAARLTTTAAADHVSRMTDEELDAEIMRLVQVVPPPDLARNEDGFSVIPEGFTTEGRDVQMLTDEELDIGLAVLYNKALKMQKTEVRR